MSSPDLPVSLRPASSSAAQRSALLGPTTTPAQRIAAYLRQIDAIFTKIEELGGRDDLYDHLTDKVAEMRLEGEALKKAAGLPSAFDALPCVRETDAMLAREIPELA